MKFYSGYLSIDYRIYERYSCVTLYFHRVSCSLVDLLCFYPHDVVSSVLTTATWLAGWLAGWVSVTRRYCIKTAKPVLKLFLPPDSPVILVSSDPCADTQFQGEPLQRGR